MKLVAIVLLACTVGAFGADDLDQFQKLGDGYDSVGNDATWWENDINWKWNSASECASRCLANVTCVAFAFEPADGNPRKQNYCTIKYAIGVPLTEYTNRPKYQFWAKKLAPHESFFYKFQGLDSSKFATAAPIGGPDASGTSPSACALRCLTVHNCTGISYDEAQKICELRSEIPLPFALSKRNTDLYVGKAGILSLFKPPEKMTYQGNNLPIPSDEIAQNDTDNYGFSSPEACAVRCMSKFVGCTVIQYDQHRTHKLTQQSGFCLCKKVDTIEKSALQGDPYSLLYIGIAVSDTPKNGGDNNNPKPLEQPGAGIGLFFAGLVIIAIAILAFPGPRNACQACLRNCNLNGQSSSGAETLRELRNRSHHLDTSEESDLLHHGGAEPDTADTIDATEMSKVSAILAEHAGDEEEGETGGNGDTDGEDTKPSQQQAQPGESRTVSIL